MMKFPVITAAIAAIALTAAFSSCTEDGGAADVTEAVTTSEITETMPETVMIPTTTCFVEDETEEEVQEPAEEYVQVSAGNEFIDFEFIEDYQGTADIGALADKAAAFMKESEEYKRSADSVESFTVEGMLKNPDAVYTLDEAEKLSAEFAEYISDGVIEPKTAAAYPADYDGDGSTEAFIIIKMPYFPLGLADGLVTVRDFIVFSDKYGNMSIVDETCNMYPVQFLNYGKFKQIAIGGDGMAGVESHISLYGVTDGRVEKLYGGRGSFAKEDCFLSFFGWQGTGAFMYYDTAALEYRVIDGVAVPKETVQAMDTDNVLADYYGDGVPPEPFELIGGKYYLAVFGAMDWGSVYVYEDGKFVNLPDSKVRCNSDYDNGLDIVTDIDIEQALAEMKPVKNADTEFIDYEFIEDYRGTADIGDLADKAVEFLKESEFYSKSMENIAEFKDEELVPYIKNGAVVPKFKTAYPNDYDGDGKTETFIEIDMPYFTHRGELCRFYIFADSGGNMSFISSYPVWVLCNAKLLDYGRAKHILIGGDGTAGAYSGNELYGVQNGDPVCLYGGRCRYYKNDCFLYTYGWQSSGDFMYFDINEGKYFAIAGEDVPLEKIKEMDEGGVLSEFYDWYDKENFLISALVGKKYYIFSKGPMDKGTAYIYKNGKFIQDEKCSYVRRSEGIWGEKDRIVDIEQAVANMKPVEN